MAETRKYLFRCQWHECDEDPHGRRMFDFESEVPVCPKCKRDRRQPENRNIIIPLVPLHWHIPTSDGPDIGHGQRYAVACDGKTVRGRSGTDNPKVVTCPKCRTMPAFREAVMEVGGEVYQDADFHVEFDQENMAIMRKEE